MRALERNRSHFSILTPRDVRTFEIKAEFRRYLLDRSSPLFDTQEMFNIPPSTGVSDLVTEAVFFVTRHDSH